MKIASAPFAIAETPAGTTSAKGANVDGSGFESAFRTVEQDAESQPRPDGAAEPRAGDDRAKTKALAARPRSVSAKDQGSEPREPADKAIDEEVDETTMEDVAGDTRSPAADLLGQLFGAGVASGVAPAATAGAKPQGEVLLPSAGITASGFVQSAEGADMSEVVLEERVVVVSLMPGATEASEAGQARGKVSLDVLHMETHFEPRTDAVVLVEAKAEISSVKAEASLAVVAAAVPPAGVKPGAKTGAQEEPSKLRLSFDEALARLGRAETSPNEVDAAVSASEAGDTRSGAAGDVGTASQRGVRADARAAKSESESEGVSAGSRAASSAPVAASRESAGASDIGLPIASMTDQVAGKIIDSLGATASAPRAGAPASSESVLRFTAGGAALKTLTIQLQPENLGVLDVTMRLVDGQLTLELAASEASTAKVLAEDREGLRKLLQHAGFTLEETSITIVSREASGQTRIDASGSSAGTRQDFGSSQGGNGQSAER
ncbi:MAG: flagellar hook-length control protein FliK, partial [Rhizobiaceae bacterium]|nr:flagellar hook-length control protein FliK [Rhizobiaceae bacterium]